MVVKQNKQKKKKKHAGVKRIPIEDFFRNPQKTGYKISPDGRFYAYRDPVKGIKNLFKKEIGEKEPVQMTFYKERDINRFNWRNKKHLIYLQDNNGDENYKIYRVNIDSKKVVCLTEFDKKVRVSIIDFFNSSVEYDLDNSKEDRVLLEDPVYDVFGDDEIDHFVYSGSRNKLIYALYTAEKRKIHFFDKEIEEIYGVGEDMLL